MSARLRNFVHRVAGVCERARCSRSSSPASRAATNRTLPRNAVLALCALLVLGVVPAVSAQDKDGATTVAPVEKAAAEKPAASAGEIIYPRNAAPADSPAAPTKSGGGNGTLLLLALGAAVAGGWFLWKQRHAVNAGGGAQARKLAIAESRSLGNRQYLVVADYGGKKFLLGVCPGRIEMLTPLDGPTAAGVSAKKDGGA